MKYTFRPHHIIFLLLTIGAIWAWTTGWECGIFDVDNCRSVQGFFRILTSATFLAVVIGFMVFSDYEKEITISNPFKEKIDPEAQELFQEWLRERDKEQLKKENLDNI